MSEAGRAVQVSYHQVPPPDAEALRDQLLALWVDVSNAGGAVGFVPPVTDADIAPVLDDALARVAGGSDVLGVLKDVDRVVGMGFLVGNAVPLRRHWRTVLRVMVHPDAQGAGAGRLLMAGLRGSAGVLGLEQLVLTVRDGHGLDRFYMRNGYRVVGRHPRAIRVAPNDLRDELMLVSDL